MFIVSFVPQFLYTLDDSSPTGLSQWQSMTQLHTDAATQRCTCQWCSPTAHENPLAWHAIEHQKPWPPCVSSIHSRVGPPSSDCGCSLEDTTNPYVNQNPRGENADDIGVVVNGQMQALFVAPEAPVRNRTFRLTVSS